MSDPKSLALRLGEAAEESFLLPGQGRGLLDGRVREGYGGLRSRGGEATMRPSHKGHGSL